MRKFPKLENNHTPDDLIHALDACTDKVRELMAMSKSRLAALRSGKVKTTKREFLLLRILTGQCAPPSWGKFSQVKIENERLYLANETTWKSGITYNELKSYGMIRADLQMLEGQTMLIERLARERDFYKKQCGYEAKYGLMLWRCFGD
nr:hypothetical protein [uncultured Deefgea sp.]